MCVLALGFKDSCTLKSVHTNLVMDTAMEQVVHIGTLGLAILISMPETGICAPAYRPLSDKGKLFASLRFLFST
jgi:hypothetical protein